MRNQWVLCGLILGLSTPAPAQDGARLSADVNLELGSKYIWHGINVVNDWVFQPGVDLNYGGFTLAFWGNLELTDWNLGAYPRDPKGRFTEIDVSFEYAGTVGKTGWNVGIVDYQYPGTGQWRYREWYAGVSREDCVGAPALTVYTGDNSSTGTYATLSLSHSVPAKLARMTSVDLGAELTWGDTRCNQFLYGHPSAGLSDLQLTVGTELRLCKDWSFSPSLHCSTLLQPGLLRGEPRRTNVWITFGVTTKF